ncbi:MAG: class I SAM-dependent methyltransferase [Pseudomonadota bacterium]
MAVSSTSADPPKACVVCLAAGSRPFMEVAGRRYWRCDVCEATFLDPGQRPTPEDELAHYRHHENDPGDPRYRAFLSKLADPLLAKLTPGMSGLDYGCGPGSALAAMLEEAGLEMALYDPFFHPGRGALQRMYDVITLSEVAEHFFEPAVEFNRLSSLLKPGGWLGVMTCFQTDDARFDNWHYRRDPTHVVFYRSRTFEVIAEQRGWSCEIPRKDVVMLQKRRGAAARTLP